MPKLIDTNVRRASRYEAISLEECSQALAEAPFEPDCTESIEHSAQWLARLTCNRAFLGDLLLGQLKERHRDAAIESGYGPQAVILSPMRERVFLRANIWPAERDHCFQSSGAKSFVYGIPHDHNFSFLTSGYFGPGYQSDYYEYDYGAVAGYEGEEVPLRFIERSALSEGKLMLYRAHQDIHSQIPPTSLSVSLNIMHVGEAQGWFDQYGFDLEAGRIDSVISPNASEVFLRVAIATGHEGALDLAEGFGRHHPSDRMRLASFEARALQAGDGSAADAIWREAEISGSRMVGAIAKRERERLACAA